MAPAHEGTVHGEGGSVAGSDQSVRLSVTFRSTPRTPVSPSITVSVEYSNILCRFHSPVPSASLAGDSQRAVAASSKVIGVGTVTRDPTTGLAYTSP